MTLSDLEFKAEDFKSIKMPMTNGRITTDIVRLDEALSLINYLWKEKLAKAKEVFGLELTVIDEDSDIFGRKVWSWVEKKNSFGRIDTHRGYLVYIEELHQNPGKPDLHLKRCKEAGE